MEFLIVGAGEMGREIAKDVIRSNKNNTVTSIDISQKSLEDTTNFVDNPRLKTKLMDITSPRLGGLMNNAKVCFGAASYTINYYLTLMAIGHGTHFCDLGGNPNVEKRQYKLDKLARSKKVCISPANGLAPGMMNILTEDGLQNVFYAIDALQRVGGLPQHPKGMLKYKIAFSPEGLINEYIEDADVIKDHELDSVEGMGGLEKISFKGFPALEAFDTGGAIHPPPFLGRVKNMNYKTIRYAGHCEKMKKLLDAFDVKAGGENKHRKELENMLKSAYSYDDGDVILARAVVRGSWKTVTYEIIDYKDEKTGETAMMRATCFPVSIIAQTMAEGKVKKYGVIPPSLVMPTQEFISQMRGKGVNIDITYD